MHVRRLLTASYGSIARQCYLLVLVFYQEKNWLRWKYVINYEVRSAIFWTLRSVERQFLPTFSCLTLEDGTGRLSRNVGS